MNFGYLGRVSCGLMTVSEYTYIHTHQRQYIPFRHVIRNSKILCRIATTPYVQ